MIHQYIRSDYNYYAGRGLMDYFITENRMLTSDSPGSYVLGWISELSDRCFYYRDGDNSATQRISCELDSDNIKSLSFRKGVYANDLAWWKFFPARQTRIAIPIGEYLNTTGFTIQMTCTYEDFNNYCGIIGLYAANRPTGIFLGQFENGSIKFGLYTINNQPIAISVPQANMPIGKFNWAFSYSYGYQSLSGYTQGMLKLYINGNFKGYAVMPEGWSWTTSMDIGAVGLSLGYAYQATNRHFKGSIYSLLMYNEALNENEIYQNYMYDKQKYLIPN